MVYFVLNTKKENYAYFYVTHLIFKRNMYTPFPPNKRSYLIQYLCIFKSPSAAKDINYTYLT